MPWNVRNVGSSNGRDKFSILALLHCTDKNTSCAMRSQLFIVRIRTNDWPVMNHSPIQQALGIERHAVGGGRSMLLLSVIVSGGRRGGGRKKADGVARTVGLSGSSCCGSGGHLGGSCGSWRERYGLLRSTHCSNGNGADGNEGFVEKMCSVHMHCHHAVVSVIVIVRAKFLANCCQFLSSQTTERGWNEKHVITNSGVHEERRRIESSKNLCTLPHSPLPLPLPRSERSGLNSIY